MSVAIVAGIFSPTATTVGGFSAEASSSPPPSSSSSKKHSNRNPSKSRSPPVKAPEKSSGRNSPNRRKHAYAPIIASKQVRSNGRKKDLVMEDVKILKRGDEERSLSPPLLSSGTGLEYPAPCITERLGPDPMSLPRPLASAFAGPAFVSSPSPSSLPVPLFLKKVALRGEDVTTRGLRCLLRLDASL